MKKMIIIIMVLVLMLSSNIYAKSPFYEEREKQANIYYELFNNDKYINKVDALAFITNIYDLNVCYNYENDTSKDKDLLNEFITENNILIDNDSIKIIYNGIRLGVVSIPDIVTSYNNLATNEEIYIMYYNLILSPKVHDYECEDFNYNESNINTFTDYNKISKDVSESISFFVDNGIISDNSKLINPKEKIKGNELYNIRKKINAKFKRVNKENYVTRIEALNLITNDYYFTGEQKLEKMYYNIPPTFNDMDLGADVYSWYKLLAVDIGMEYGIISGYIDKTFDPEAYITKEDALVIFYRFITNSNSEKFKVKPTENDINIQNLYTMLDYEVIDEYAKIPLAFFINKGILEVNNKKVEPQKNLSYEEYLEFKEKIARLFMNSKDYSDFMKNM